LVVAPLVALLAVPLAAPLGVARAADDLDAGIRELTQRIVPQVQQLGKKRLAVVDFADLEGRVSDLGRFVAEELSASLVLAGGGLRVADRQHLSKIIEEQKLSAVGITEPNAVQKLGQLAGADVIVTGSVVDMGDEIRITAKVLSTTTGDIIAAAQTTVPDDATVQRMLGQDGPPRPAASAAPPAGAGRPATALGDVPVVSALPDGFHFSYIAKPVDIAGRPVAGGLLVYPSNGHTQLTYDLGKRYDEFDAFVGVPQATAVSVQVIFRVYADGALVHAGRALRAGDPAIPLRVPVRGVRALTLDVEGAGIPAGGSFAAYALWGEPRLIAH